MAIEVFWDNPEQTIIRQDLGGMWTSEQYFESVMQMYSMMKTVSHRVHIVVDLTNVVGHPTRMAAAAPRLNAHLPPNRGLTVGINVPRYIVTIIHVATRLYPRLGRHVYFVKSLQEAYEVIKTYGGDRHLETEEVAWQHPSIPKS